MKKHAAKRNPQACEMLVFNLRHASGGHEGEREALSVV